jgi:hypothetical protein
MYTLIHLPDYGFRGKATLFSAQRKSDGKGPAGDLRAGRGSGAF